MTGLNTTGGINLLIRQKCIIKNVLGTTTSGFGRQTPSFSEVEVFCHANRIGSESEDQSSENVVLTETFNFIFNYNYKTNKILGYVQSTEEQDYIDLNYDAIIVFNNKKYEIREIDPSLNTYDISAIGFWKG